MILFRRFGLLIALTSMSCGQIKSIDVVSNRPAVAHRSSSGNESTPSDESLFGEAVLDGGRVDPFAKPETKAVVLIFVSTDCPIANRYAPVLGRLYEAYQPRNVSFWLVYADATETPEKIRQHVEEYQHQIPALRDMDHRLAKFCEARRTPEAVVFSAGRNRQYRGRIDDRFTGYGKSREFASRHDLQEAIEAVLAGKAVPTPVTEAIGCLIPGVEE